MSEPVPDKTIVYRGNAPEELKAFSRESDDVSPLAFLLPFDCPACKSVQIVPTASIDERLWQCSDYNHEWQHPKLVIQVAEKLKNKPPSGSIQIKDWYDHQYSPSVFVMFDKHFQVHWSPSGNNLAQIYKDNPENFISEPLELPIPMYLNGQINDWMDNY